MKLKKVEPQIFITASNPKPPSLLYMAKVALLKLKTHNNRDFDIEEALEKAINQTEKEE